MFKVEIHQIPGDVKAESLDDIAKLVGYARAHLTEFNVIRQILDKAHVKIKLDVFRDAVFISDVILDPNRHEFKYSGPFSLCSSNLNSSTQDPSEQSD